MSFNITPVSQVKTKTVAFKANEATQQQKISQVTTDKLDLSNKEEDTNWLKIAAWSAGILVAAGAAYYFIRRGKLKADDAKSTTSTAIDNIKKFFDKDNKIIEGVKLEKGKALMADGNGFTGVFKTTDKTGRNIAISYENGVMTSSEINGKLFKSYHNKEANGIRETLIIHHSNEGKQYIKHCFHDNGKIRYIRKEPKIYENGEINFSFGTLAEYSKSGKKILEAQFDPHNRKVFAKFYDENGNMYKHQYAIWDKNKPNKHTYRIQEDIISNGQVIKSRQHYDFNVLNHALTQEPHSPVIVIKNGINYTSGGKGLVRTAKDCEVSAEYTQHGMGMNADFTIKSEHNGITTGLLSVDIEGKIKDTILPKDKNMLKDFFSKVEDLLKVAKEENMYTSIFDEEIANAPKWFKVLKEHFLK